MKKTDYLLLFAGVLVSATGYAADIEVKSAWVRATVPAQTVSGAYMQITSKAGATLVGVSTPVAEAVEVHEMTMDGGVMKMRAVPRLALSAGKTLTLKPGGYHIMLMGLKQKLKPGDKVSVTLKIENAKKKIQRVQVDAEVRNITESSKVHDHKH